MALAVEISNSWVHGLPTEKNFIPFFSGEHPGFWTTSSKGKATTKLHMSVDQ